MYKSPHIPLLCAVTQSDNLSCFKIVSCIFTRCINCNKLRQCDFLSRSVKPYVGETLEQHHCIFNLRRNGFQKDQDEDGNNTEVHYRICKSALELTQNPLKKNK